MPKRSTAQYARWMLEASILAGVAFLWSIGALRPFPELLQAIAAVVLMEWLSQDLPWSEEVGEELHTGGSSLQAKQVTTLQDSTIAASVDQGEFPRITMEDLRKHDMRDDCWLAIDNKVYDLSKWFTDHPGGPLPILNMAGCDATDAFYAFHPRGTYKRLRPMLVGNLVGGEPSPIVKDFRDLRQKMIDAGLFDINVALFVRNFLMILSLLPASILCVLATQGSEHSYLWTIAAMVLMGMFFNQIAGIGHDTGHNSFTHSRAWDRRFGIIVGNLLSGISIGWWKKTHNTHHTVPNSVERDPDIQHLPAFAVSEKYFAGIFSLFHDWEMPFHTVAKILVMNQHWLYIPVMMVARVNLYVQSLLYIVGVNSHQSPVDWQAAELISEMAFFTWFGYVCSLLPSARHILLFFVGTNAVAGLLEVQITISHFSMTTYDGVKYKDGRGTWVETQLETSMNVDCSPWLDWFHIGLQFQIEHHLFPRLPRHNLREAEGLVKAFCKRHDLHHHSAPFFGAVAQTLGHMRKVALKARATPAKQILFMECALLRGLMAEG